jgi:hypothetical protein
MLTLLRLDTHLLIVYVTVSLRVGSTQGGIVVCRWLLNRRGQRQKQIPYGNDKLKERMATRQKRIPFGNEKPKERARSRFPAGMKSKKAAQNDGRETRWISSLRPDSVTYYLDTLCGVSSSGEETLPG